MSEIRGFEKWANAALSVAGTNGMSDDQVIPTWPEGIDGPELTIGMVKSVLGSNGGEEVPDGFTRLALNRETGEWLYINHAGTWQTCPCPAPPSVAVPDDDLSHAAQFLLDRLADWGTEYIQEEGMRDWMGHVEHAIARLRSALSAPVAMPDGLDIELIVNALDDYEQALTNGELDGAGHHLPSDIELQGKLLSLLTAAPATDQHPDDAAVDRFAAAMKAKLAKARDKGRAGWDDPEQCSVEFLADLLLGHIGKGNPGNFEDIANLAMMLHQRGAEPSVLTQSSHIADAGKMIPVHEDTPKMGVPVIGYNPDWIDPDFNDRGYRECFTYGDATVPGGEWHTAKWVDGADQYETTDEAPTHWFPIGPCADAVAVIRAAQCFDIAHFEGWDAALETGNLPAILDIWQRRVSWAETYINEAMNAAPQPLREDALRVRNQLEALTIWADHFDELSGNSLDNGHPEHSEAMADAAAELREEVQRLQAEADRLRTAGDDGEGKSC
jgi:hypothetical protein